jgi:cyclopropane fatty-acyl-phospholipid synthase-like methyltransferase
VLELFANLDRLAPGSAETTRRALAMVPDLDARLRALELGCGCGAASSILATSLPGTLVAVDLHEPFVARLQERAMALGLADRIDARVADMRDPSLEPHAFDLVWAEGSLYTIGFDEGLALCRRLLAPGGVMAISELVWLREQPSADARTFWTEHYPQMRDRTRLLAELRERGFAVHGELVLPRSDWDNYYDPLRERVALFADGPDPDLRADAAMVAREIQIHERFGDEYGYVFVVAGLA